MTPEAYEAGLEKVVEDLGMSALCMADPIQIDLVCEDTEGNIHTFYLAPPDDIDWREEGEINSEQAAHEARYVSPDRAFDYLPDPMAE